MRVVKPSLTNSALRPFSGWVRTTGWMTFGDLRQLLGGQVGRQLPSNLVSA
jgi:hypothetical protein